ncbi:MAG: hypothetical protein KAG56_00205 [Sulfurovaceae bacterium]|nr:hypothetical protein [Sulfurovaceae bacterium]
MKLLYFEILFDNGKQKVVIENRQSEMIVPQNCKAWFDGCNNCARVEGNTVACTEMACGVDKPEEFRCTKWE